MTILKTYVFNGHSDQFLDIKTLAPLKKSYGKEYYDLTGVDSVQTKRGCPFLCDYCTYPQIEGRKYRIRDPGEVAVEMQEVLRTNPQVSHFFIVDSVFNHPIFHAKAVCNQIIEKNINCDWTCYISPKKLNRELAILMKKAGCKGCELGSDSGVDSVLTDLKKGFTTDDILEATRICHEVGILDCHTFVLGTENENMSDVIKTLEFVSTLNVHSAIFMIWQDDHDSVTGNINSDRLKLKNDITNYLEIICTKHPNWIVPELGINFNPKMLNFLRKRGLRGPLWQQL